ncbi:MAG: response regulator [Pseudomonadota bacterium]
MHIALIDDHHLFREGIRLVLSAFKADAVFYQADSCETALKIEPDAVELVLLDFHLPGISGHDAFKRIRDHFRQAAMVILSGEENPGIIRQLISNGAAGFIHKNASPEVLHAALNLVMAGGVYLPPSILDEQTAGNANSSALAALSTRQRAVLSRAVKGKINKVIADELNIAEGTVKAHLSAAFKALDVSNRTEAVFALSKLGIVLDE